MRFLCAGAGSAGLGVCTQIVDGMVEAGEITKYTSYIYIILMYVGVMCCCVVMLSNWFMWPLIDLYCFSGMDRDEAISRFVIVTSQVIPPHFRPCISLPPSLPSVYITTTPVYITTTPHFRPCILPPPLTSVRVYHHHPLTHTYNAIVRTHLTRKLPFYSISFNTGRR